MEEVRHAHPRNRLLGLLLIPLTLGIYFFYWAYRAHAELYDRFNLERDGRRDPTVWLVLGLAFPPLLYVYYALMARNVAHAEARLRLPRLSSGLLVSVALVPVAAVAVAMIALLTLAKTVEWPDAKLGQDLLAWLLFSSVAAVTLSQMLAYTVAQTHINRVWRASTRASTVPPAGSSPASPPAGAMAAQSRSSTPPANRAAFLR